MRALDAMSVAVRWRWTPFYALVVASSLYVLLIVLVMPTSFGGRDKGSSAALPNAGLDDTMPSNAVGAAAGRATRSTSLAPVPRHVAAGNAFGFNTPPTGPATPVVQRRYEPPLPAAAPVMPPPPPPPPAPMPIQRQEEPEQEEAPQPVPAPRPARFFGGRLQHVIPPPQAEEPPANAPDDQGGDDQGGNDPDPPAEGAPELR